MGSIRGFGDIDFDEIHAGDLSGSGVINRVVAKGLGEPGGPDSDSLSDLYASLWIRNCIHEILEMSGQVLPPTVILNHIEDSDGDGF